MLNFIWVFCILFGILFALITGEMAAVSDAVLSAGKDAVNLALTMAGIVATWSGIMKLAEKGGMIATLSDKFYPLLHFLFPSIPKKSKAMQYISANFVANFLGLGWAATPAGILAMKELQKYNHKKDTASNAICMFMIINMSSLQLITINILAYRQQYGSANPGEIIGPGIVATFLSTIIGVFAGKLLERWWKH